MHGFLQLGRLRRALASRRTRRLIEALPPDVRRDIGWPEGTPSRLTSNWPRLWSL